MTENKRTGRGEIRAPRGGVWREGAFQRSREKEWGKHRRMREKRHTPDNRSLEEGLSEVAAVCVLNEDEETRHGRPVHSK